MCSRLSAVLTLALSLVGVGHAAAQSVTTAAVRGTISADGRPVEGAQVVVRNPATGFAKAVTTGSEGTYYVPNLLPGGPYTVAANGAGYQEAQQAGIQLVLSQTTTVDLELAQQAVAVEGITVTAENNPQISRSRTGASTVVGQRELNDVPTLNRNFTDIARVSPYATVGGDGVSVAGANNRFNNIQIDGAVNNDLFGLAASGVPGGQANAKPIPMGAIQQFQVLVTPFDVRQTGFTGGLINAVTKSGTNDFKGSLYTYYRNNQLVRDSFDVAGRSYTAGDFSVAQYGFTFGGPIVRDKLHFFVAGERETRDVPETFGIASDAADLRVTQATLQNIISTAEGYGLNPGSATRLTDQTRLGNLFGRLDWTINGNNRLVLRHNYAPARSDAGASRGGSYFDLSSATYYYDATTNSTVAQLFSDLGEATSNELLLNYTSVRDRPSPSEWYSKIQVSTHDSIGGRALSTNVRLGSEYYRQANELDQNVFEATDNLTRELAGHRLTFGVNAQYLHFRNLFFPGSLGYYSFSSPENFAAGDASYYEIMLPLRQDPSARFNIFQLGGYAQDEWSVNDALTLTLGVRADVPWMLDQPTANPDFQTAFGRSTADVPSGNVLFSPRLGFNWQHGDLLATQVRGGVGLFTGRPPFVWLSNLYGNTGREGVLLSCSGDNVPAFDPLSPPTSCLNGGGAPVPPPATVNVAANDFKFPQDLKVSMGVDQQLPGGVTATLEGLYSKAVNQLMVRELNLAGPQSVPASAMQGIGNRTIYGQPTTSTSFGAFDPVRANDGFRNVVELDNTSRGYTYSVTGELAKTFFDRYSLRGSYTYMKATDVMSLTSSIATSNYGYNAVGSDIYDRPATASEFSRPHKVTLLASGRLFGATDLTVLYTGQSGRRYSYVYNGDINGDGYQGPGLYGRNNDLIYVPATSSEVTWASDGDRQLFDELVTKDQCLQDARGSILARNSCRYPWTNNLDVRVQQGLPRVGVGNLKLELNIFNFLNLLNSDWGISQYGYGTDYALRYVGRSDPTDPNSAPVFSYAGYTSKDSSGTTHAVLPYSVSASDSRYTVQLGLSYAF